MPLPPTYGNAFGKPEGPVFSRFYLAYDFFSGRTKARDPGTLYLFWYSIGSNYEIIMNIVVWKKGRAEYRRAATQKDSRHIYESPLFAHRYLEEVGVLFCPWCCRLIQSNPIIHRHMTDTDILFKTTLWRNWMIRLNHCRLFTVSPQLDSQPDCIHWSVTD